MRHLILILLLLPARVLWADTYNPRQFGAKGDGRTIDTKALQAAIDKATKAGGGRVVLTPGKYKCGTVFLKSNVELYLEAGAVLFGSDSIKDYIAMRWGADRNKDREPYHLLAAEHQHNISITGKGTIDGNGKAFWATGKALFNLPPDSIPPHPEWIMSKSLRVSPMVEIDDCQDVDIDGLTLTNASGWTLHLLASKRITVHGLRILNNLFSPNSDGIDVTGSQDVVISDCIINTCDDAICLKTSPDGMLTENVVVTNCIIKTMCVALKLGNESYGDMRQITFSNCVVHMSSRLIGVYAADGGTLENIIFSNIVGNTRAPFIFNRPIHISLIHREQPEFVGTRRGAIRNITIENFTCETDGRILIATPDGDSIQGLTLRNIRLTYPRIEDPLPNVPGARSAQFSPGSEMARRARAALVVENVTDFTLDGFAVRWPSGPVPKAWRFGERIEHGGNRRFTPDYSRVRETEFEAMYLRHVLRPHLLNVEAQPSAPSARAQALVDDSGMAPK